MQGPEEIVHLVIVRDQIPSAWASLVAQLVDRPAMQETPVGFLGGEVPLEKG